MWDVESGKALCGNTAGNDYVQQVKFFNNSDDQLITCQNYGIKLWKVDYVQKKVLFENFYIFAYLKSYIIAKTY